jgi:hypothetical protein
MSETSALTGPRPVVAIAQVVLWLFIAAAATVAVLSAVSGIGTIVHSLASGLTPVTLVADKGAALFQLNDTHASPHIVSGHFSTATVTVSHLSAWVVTITIVSAVATLLTELTLCAMVALLAWRLLRRRLFRRSLSVTVIAAGFVLAVGGTLSQSAAAIAGGATASALNGGGRGYWPLAGRFDPTVAVFGIVIILVGLVFEYGGRLQKDTEGLV